MTRKPSILWLVTAALWRTIVITTTVLPPNGVTPLATRSQMMNRPHKMNGSSNNTNRGSRLFLDRRKVLSDVFGAATAVLLLQPGVASAGIDVSGLKVEANPLDVFMGGTYYEDDESDREGIDGRISRKKYTILEGMPGGSRLIPSDGSSNSKKKKDFFEGLDRPVRILGESTSISSSRDDAFELNGTLYACNEKGSKGCITIDFSPIGGPKEVKGYWDENEKGIRFLESQKVWSKQ